MGFFFFFFWVNTWMASQQHTQQQCPGPCTAQGCGMAGAAPAGGTEQGMGAAGCIRGSTLPSPHPALHSFHLVPFAGADCDRLAPKCVTHSTHTASL